MAPKAVTKTRVELRRAVMLVDWWLQDIGSKVSHRPRETVDHSWMHVRFNPNMMQTNRVPRRPLPLPVVGWKVGGGASRHVCVVGSNIM